MGPTSHSDLGVYLLGIILKDSAGATQKYTMLVLIESKSPNLTMRKTIKVENMTL